MTRILSHTVRTGHMTEQVTFEKEDIDALAKQSTEVVNILRSNDEQFTENQYGYMFDLNKLSHETRLKLKQLKDNAKSIHEVPMSFHESGSRGQQLLPRDDTHATEARSKTVSITPKFLSEYNADLQKLTVKPASMIKFLNAKKKYLRNSDNTIFTKIDLKREVFT